MSDDQQEHTEPPLPDDPAELRAQLLAERKKHGTLLNDLRKQKAARAELSAKLQAWNGITPEQARAWQLERAREGGGEVDKLLEQQRQRYEQTLAAHTKTIERLTIDTELDRQLDKLVDPRLKAGAARLHRDKIKLIEDEESDTGLRPVIKFGDDYMSIDEYLKAWVDSPEGQPYLKPSLASGAGAMPANGSRRPSKTRSAMTALEKSQHIRAHGLAAYNALPWK